MKIAFLSYPMLFQGRIGLGLQNVVLDTIEALRTVGVEAKLMDIVNERMDQYDLIQVYCATHGNHRIVETAKRLQIPVVLAPRRSPDLNRRRALIGDFCERLVGKLTGYEERTTYGHIRDAIQTADFLHVRGESERKAIIDAYGARPERIGIIRNGVAQRFFDATPERFEALGLVSRPFILCASAISEYKNQLGVIEALRDDAFDFVLAGPCHREGRAYLQACVDAAPGRVHYLGELHAADPVLMSAFAAATIHVLVSEGETGPNVALESLAAGTPVLIPSIHGIELPEASDLWCTAHHGDAGSIRSAARGLLRAPKDPARCRALVRDYSWTCSARELQILYTRVLAGHGDGTLV